MLKNQQQSIAVRIARRVFRWLLTVFILVVSLWLLFLVTGKALCHIAIDQIAELTGTKIQTESIDFHTNGSVFIKNLIIRPHKREAGDDTILKAQTVFGRFSIASLLLLRPRLKVITINGFVFNAQYDMDTDLWNLSALKLKIPTGGSGKMPLILLNDGTLQYSKISNGQVKVAASVPLTVKFGFDQQATDAYSFEITTAKLASGFGQSRLTGSWKPGSITIAGGISSIDSPTLEAIWIIDHLAAELKYDQNNAFALKLRIKDFQSKRTPTLDRFAQVSPPSIEKSSSFTALQKFFNRYQPSGRIDLELDASGNLKNLSELLLSGKVYCKDVAICYKRFPYTIEHLTGQATFTQDSAEFNNLVGQHRNVKLLISGWTRDFGPNWKYQLRVTSDNMALDNDLYSALGAKQKELWSAFAPRGLVSTDYQVARFSQTDRKETLAVKLIDAQALYRNVPYPLENLTGTLFFDADTIVVSDVASRTNSQKIIFNGIVSHSTEIPIYNIAIDVNNVPLDSTLRQALPDSQKRLLNQFDLTGLVDGRINISSPSQNTATTFTADISFKEASLSLNKPLVAISDVSAAIVLTPDSINIKKLTGQYNQGQLSLTGQVWPDEHDRQSRYNLFINLRQTQLNDQLFSLLPQPLRKNLQEFQPGGKVNLTADLTRPDSLTPPTHKITVNCLGNTVTFQRFPYPLKDITGTVTITDDTIAFRNITAAPADNVPIPADNVTIQAGKPTIKLNGQISLTDNAFNKAVFQLSAKDISFSEKLTIALPKTIQSFYRSLSPVGQFDLDFNDISILKADDGKKSIDLAGAATFKDCAFNVSSTIAELDATVKIKALYKTGSGLCNANAILLADNLTIHGKSVTLLRADVDYDPNLHKWSTQNLLADFYGGKLIGALEFKHPTHTNPDYLLQVAFDNVDLKQFLCATSEPRTLNPESQVTTGKMSGSLSLSTGIADTASRIGICRLAISEMQVGRLSPLGKLLYVLKLTEPRDFAFSQMLVNSYIKQDRLFFRKLDLSGRALAFYGSGQMNLRDSSIDLTLIARGARLATADPSVLQSLTEGLGQAVVQLQVTGNFDAPQVTTRPFPVIKKSLEILGTTR
jgi:hypothetical protein